MSGSSTCRSCGRPIVWGVSTNGRNIPVDPEPRADGNLRLVATGMKEGRIVFQVRSLLPEAAERHKLDQSTVSKIRKAGRVLQS